VLFTSCTIAFEPKGPESTSTLSPTLYFATNIASYGVVKPFFDNRYFIIFNNSWFTQPKDTLQPRLQNMFLSASGS
jgi:hypothetical protein